MTELNMWLQCLSSILGCYQAGSPRNDGLYGVYHQSSGGLCRVGLVKVRCLVLPPSSSKQEPGMVPGKSFSVRYLLHGQGPTDEEMRPVLGSISFCKGMFTVSRPGGKVSSRMRAVE